MDKCTKTEWWKSPPWNKGKRMKRTKDSLRDLWDNIKHTDVHIIRVQKRKREKGPGKIFEEIIAKNLPDMEKIPCYVGTRGHREEQKYLQGTVIPSAKYHKRHSAPSTSDIH